jgi:hypothetical protein
MNMKIKSAFLKIRIDGKNYRNLVLLIFYNLYGYRIFSRLVSSQHKKTAFVSLRYILR